VAVPGTFLQSRRLLKVVTSRKIRSRHKHSLAGGLHSVLITSGSFRLDRQVLTANCWHLVAAINAVLLIVALPVDRDTSSIGTPEFCVRAGPAHCNNTQRDNSVLTVACRQHAGRRAKHTHTHTPFSLLHQGTVQPVSCTVRKVLN
jgi:hypothetical protein